MGRPKSLYLLIKKKKNGYKLLEVGYTGWCFKSKKSHPIFMQYVPLIILLKILCKSDENWEGAGKNTDFRGPGPKIYMAYIRKKSNIKNFILLSKNKIIQAFHIQYAYKILLKFNPFSESYAPLKFVFSKISSKHIFQEWFFWWFSLNY